MSPRGLWWAELLMFAPRSFSRLVPSILPRWVYSTDTCSSSGGDNNTSLVSGVCGLDWRHLASQYAPMFTQRWHFKISYNCKRARILSIGLWRWYINVTITIMSIIHRPVLYLKLISVGLSVPDTNHITSPLRAQQINAIYRFATPVYWHIYHNFEPYPSSCLLFKTRRFGD
jgi:hypothetical protein